MPSSLHQKIYVKGLPSGVKMTIEAVNVKCPNDEEWFGSFTARPLLGTNTINHKKAYNYIKTPYEVSPSISDGLIGETKFDGYSGLWSTGRGAKVDLTFRLKGRATVNNTSADIDVKGYISISASEWKGTERPDYSNVTYYWGNGDMPAINLSISVPPSIAGMPEDAYFVFGTNTNDKKIGANVTTYKAVIDKVLDYAIRGIFLVNKELAGWAFGKIVPFP